MIELSMWFMFPIAIGIATLAMMMGIGGAVLFSPLFMLVLKLEPITALAAGIIIEFFGFSSGLYGYLREKVIPFSSLTYLLVYSVIGTSIGVIIAQFVSGQILKLILLFLLIYLSGAFLIKHKKCQPLHIKCMKKDTKEHFSSDIQTNLTTGFGGILLGMISSGLGEINEYNFLKRKHLSPSVAAGSSVFLVSISALVSIIFHLYFIISNGELGAFNSILSIVIFSVPGVIIGAQLGVKLSKKIKGDIMENIAGGVFAVISLLLLLSIIIA